MKIFISYSRVDRAFVDEIVVRIKRVHRDSDIWFDHDLTGGQDWWAEILNQVAACDTFLYLMSNESLASEYCSKELAEARRLGKAILPVVVRARTPIPAELGHLHYVDMSKGANNPDALTDLMAALQNSASASPRLTTVPSHEAINKNTPAKVSSKPKPAPTNMNQHAKGNVVIQQRDVQEQHIHLPSETTAQEREANRKQLLRKRKAIEDELFEMSVDKPENPLRLILMVVALVAAVLSVVFLLSNNTLIGIIFLVTAIVSVGVVLKYKPGTQPDARKLAKQKELQAIDQKLAD